MASNFQETIIGDVCSVGDGAHAKVKRQSSGIQYLTSKNIGHGSLKLDSVDYISQDDFDRLFTNSSRSVSKLMSGDVLIGIIGTFGNAYRYKESDNFGISSSVAILRPDQTILDPDFLYYTVTSPSFRTVHSAYKGGSVQGYTNIPTIKALPITLPPLDEQKKIAHILGTLDDKIELNQQMNQTLEGIARALFKSWFIDFDPVRAKLDGRQPAGMDAETAALFPDSFEDSPLGKIPKGWEVKPLDKIAHFLNGLALQKYPPKGEDFLPVIKIAEMRKGITENSGKASSDIDQQYVIADGDILFSWSGSLDVMIWCNGKGALNQHLFKVTSANYPKWFAYYWVKTYLEEFRAIAASKATTMGHIQRRHLTEALTVVAPDSILKKADEKISPLLTKFIESNLEVRTLLSIRDALLPKLLSGEIRVKGAEQALEAVA